MIQSAVCSYQETGATYTNGAATGCKRDGVIKLHPLSHPQSHSGSHRLLSKPLIPLTQLETYMPSMGSGKGSGEKRGATHRKTGVLRPPQVFLRHTRRVGSLPSKLSVPEGGLSTCGYADAANRGPPQRYTVRGRARACGGRSPNGVPRTVRRHPMEPVSHGIGWQPTMGACSPATARPSSELLRWLKNIKLTRQRARP